MLISQVSARLRLILPLLFVTIFVCLSSFRLTPSQASEDTLKQRFPLAWKHIQSFNGTGGGWYIPPEWIEEHDHHPQNILEAARLASKAASMDPLRQIPLSNIPLIVHQTWKNTEISTWNVEILSWVEMWLEDATASKRGRPMAYLFWDDEGIMAFMQHFERGFLDSFESFFTPVERADIFRILVCNWFGGIYGDVDTEPLQHPSTWINQSDVAPWTDPETRVNYGISSTLNAVNTQPENTHPVSLVWGLEADLDPTSDSFWRMGYTYPVQLTQWALASARNHPVLTQFMKQLNARLKSETKGGEIPSIKADPLTRTGPAAVTLATKTWLEGQYDFRWNALTGLKDGGKAKLISDVLVLPITGFSPGRGKYGNMGSKAITDPDARLYHHARGSWRHFNFRVEYGKFCRTMFGLCKDWSKVA